MRPEPPAMSILKAVLALCAIALLAAEARASGALTSPAAALESSRTCTVATLQPAAVASGRLP
jgi:hypothetical protein